MDYFKNKTVLVTGAAGFIGSHLVDALLVAEARVLGVDNLITGRMENLEHLYDVEAKKSSHERFEFVQADAGKFPDEYLPAEVNLDAVFHLASPASPPRYQAHPVATYLINTVGTHNLLTYLKQKYPGARFLFASTSEVYGDPEVHPQPESYWGNVNPNGERSCYDESKRMGEAICGVFSRKYSMDVRIARIFNTYGPRIDPTDGRVIPNLAMQALKGEPLTVYGDGSQTRSYCYVSDLVRGLMLLMSVDKAKGETVNLGNPEEHSIMETARIIEEAVRGPDAELEIEYMDLPKDDPTRRQPDISKAKELLSWEPKVAFAEGLRATLEYFRDIA